MIRVIRRNMQLLTPTELSDALRVAPSQVNKYRQKGMPYLKLSHRVIRYNLADVLAWLEQFKCNSPAAGSTREDTANE